MTTNATATWTCRCKAAQLALQQIRMYPGMLDQATGVTGPGQPKWIYQCPVCGAEAVAAPQQGSELHSCAPLFAWLAPAADDDTELGGRPATPEETEALGDILALNPARDENNERVVWQ